MTMGLYGNKLYNLCMLSLLISSVTPRFLDEAANSDINAVRIRLAEEKSQRLLLKNDVESLMVKMGEMEQKISMKPSEISAAESSARKIHFNAKLTGHMDIDSLHIIVFDKVLTNVGMGYSSSTGIFSAPKTGLYLLSLTILSSTKGSCSDRYDEIGLAERRNDEYDKLRVRVEQDHAYAGHGSEAQRHHLYETSDEVTYGVRNEAQRQNLYTMSDEATYDRHYQDKSNTGKRQKLVVMAIDFGTTYTGYAFSFHHSPSEIISNNMGRGQTRVPTIILLDASRKIHSFGDQAKAKYIELMKKNAHKDWYYFDNFKMVLYNQEEPLYFNMTITESTGKRLPAIDIFTEAIRFIKKQFLETLQSERLKVQVKEDEVHYIITVPAIWSDLSKQFMRQAAIQAGIPGDALSLALEPEAASLHCKRMSADLQRAQTTRYIVADLGGGTVDFTCHEVHHDTTLKELCRPSGGSFGGTKINNVFIEVLRDIFGENILNEFKTQNIEDFYYMLDRFELKKKTFKGTDKIVLQFPLSLQRTFTDITGKTVADAVRQSPHKDEISFRQDKMHISLSLARHMFDEAVVNIVAQTREIVDNVGNIDMLVLVGGFSESSYLKEAVFSTFKSQLKIFSPTEPSSAVLKGAVLYGHQPDAITSRVCRYTYGIARMMRFKKNIHRSDKRIVIDDVSWVDGLFCKHIEVGETVRMDDNFEAHEYYPVTTDMTQASLEVYASPQKHIMYVDEVGCQRVGLIKLDLTGGDINAKVFVKLIFGGTELIVEAKEEKTGKVTVGNVQFLG